MSLDPFEARLQFLKMVRTLNASQQSIHKVVAFAVKYGARCAEDLWECVVDEVGKVSPNARINILYFLDSLAETSLTLGPPDAPYIPLIETSLLSILSNVVPPSREGILNARSARLILESWRARRILSQPVVDAGLAQIDSTTKHATAAGEDKGKKRSMPRADVLRRIEEDRERHKRLRERMWILPIPPLRTQGSTTASPAAVSPHPGAVAVQEVSGPPQPLPLDVEFEQMWEATSDFGDDDLESMRE